MQRTALISGITGQDGAYLAQLLLGKGYFVHGIVRRKADNIVWRFDEIGITGNKNLYIHIGDVTDSMSVFRIMDAVSPDEVYNLAGQSFVAASFECPVSTFEINATGTLNMLEAAHKLQESRPADSPIKFYQASTSEMFGLVSTESQNEHTPFHPRSPYGVSKLAAHWAAINYRETYGLYSCSGILFNHESPLRGMEFVTRKVANGVARIVAGRDKELRLGNIDAVRDWGYAPDYAEAMWLMLQQTEAHDYVISTGKSHTVRDMCEIAFSYCELDYNDYVVIDSKFYRPCEVPVLKGNSHKAEIELGWKPKKQFKQMITDMVDAELRRDGTVLPPTIKENRYGASSYR